MAIEALTLDDFAKGQNTYTRDTMIADNESPGALNVYGVGKNSIAKRPGTVLFCTIPGVSKVDGLGTFSLGATKKQVAMAGGSLYDITSGSPVLIASGWTSGLKTDFCMAGAKLFIQNGTDVLKYYDGTTVATQTNGIIGTNCIFYKSCLWTFGNSSSGNETRLYRSGSDASIGDFTYNVSTNPLATSIYISKDDGQKLKGLYKFQDFLYAVKERSLYRAAVAADSAGTISLEMVDPSRGTDSHATIDSVENDNFMFYEYGVLATGYEPNILDQIRTNIVSTRIDPDIKSIQKSALPNTCGLYFDQRYHLSYASGGSAYNDTIHAYDRQRLGWWKWQLAAQCFNSFKDGSGYTRMYFGSSTDGKIYYFDDSSRSDNQLSFSTSWLSPKFSFKEYSREKFYLNTLLYMGKRTGTVTINIYVDGELINTEVVAIGSSGGGGIGVGAIGAFAIGAEPGNFQPASNLGADFISVSVNKIGRNIQVEILEDEASGSWELNALVFQIKKLNPIYQPNTL